MTVVLLIADGARPDTLTRAVASGRAPALARLAAEGDEWVITGEKYYISGAGDPRCKIMIVMCKTSPDASPQFQQSQILVPVGTPGLEILGPMTVFGHDHAPRGHMHLKFNNCRVPAANMLLGEGRGFEQPHHVRCGVDWPVIVM